jgi:hypothetical protein
VRGEFADLAEGLMRAAKFFVAAAAVLLICSCGPVLTLNPLFDDSELIYDPALLGTWGDGHTSLIFEPGEGKIYKLTYRDGTKVSVLAGKLGCLDEQMFLDIYPADGYGAELEKESYAPLLPLHTVMRVQIENNALVLDTLDEDWVKKQVDEGSLDLDSGQVVKSEDAIFIVLPTDKLKNFIRGHAYDDEAFPPSDPLPRME